MRKRPVYRVAKIIDEITKREPFVPQQREVTDEEFDRCDDLAHNRNAPVLMAAHIAAYSPLTIPVCDLELLRQAVDAGIVFG